MANGRGIELHCRKCGAHLWLSRVAPDQSCDCGAGLFRRQGDPPRPATHWRQIVNSFFTLRGVLFFAGVAVFGSLPVGLAQRIAAVLVYLAAMKLATRAMKVTRAEPVQFPEVSAEELFDFAALVPAAVFVLLFNWLPPILMAFGASGVLDLAPEVRDEPAVVEVPAADDPDDDEGFAALPSPPDPVSDPATDPAWAAGGEADEGGGVAGLVAIAIGLLLLAWAPMALVLYLRTGTTFGYFHVPEGINMLRADPRGYLVLAALVLPTLGVRFIADLMQAALPFFLAPPIVVVKAAAIILGWGLAGLYVRQHARTFDMPIDDDDWVLHTRLPPPAAPAPDSPRARPAAIDLDGPPVVQGTALPIDDLPVIGGKLEE